MWCTYYAIQNSMHSKSEFRWLTFLLLCLSIYTILILFIWRRYTKIKKNQNKKQILFIIRSCVEVFCLFVHFSLCRLLMTKTVILFCFVFISVFFSAFHTLPLNSVLFLYMISVFCCSFC